MVGELLIRMVVDAVAEHGSAVCAAMIVLLLLMILAVAICDWSHPPQ